MNKQKENIIVEIVNVKETLTNEKELIYQIIKMFPNDRKRAIPILMIINDILSRYYGLTGVQELTKPLKGNYDISQTNNTNNEK